MTGEKRPMLDAGCSREQTAVAEMICASVCRYWRTATWFCRAGVVGNTPIKHSTPNIQRSTSKHPLAGWKPALQLGGMVHTPMGAGRFRSGRARRCELGQVSRRRQPSIPIDSHQFPAFLKIKFLKRVPVRTRDARVRSPVRFGWIKVNQG